MAVKDGADLDADKEDEEQVQAEDPTNLGVVVVLELVGLEVRLEHGSGVDKAKRGTLCAERAENDQPSLEAAIRERELGD